MVRIVVQSPAFKCCSTPWLTNLSTQLLGLARDDRMWDQNYTHNIITSSWRQRNQNPLLLYKSINLDLTFLYFYHNALIFPNLPLLVFLLLYEQRDTWWVCLHPQHPDQIIVSAASVEHRGQAPWWSAVSSSPPYYPDAAGHVRYSPWQSKWISLANFPAFICTTTLHAASFPSLLIDNNL